MNPRRSLLCFATLALACASVIALPGSARADADIPTASKVRVHIASPAHVRLERRASRRAAWEPACEAPCDQDLPLAEEYRVAFGEDGGPGDAFRLRATSNGRVLLTVDPPSTSGKVGGVTLIVLGSALAVASVIGLTVGVSGASQRCGPQSSDWCGLGKGVGTFIALVSGGGLLLGGGLIAGGAVLLDSSGGSATQKPMTAFVRSPTWVGPDLASTSKPAIFVPLSFSF